MIARSNIDLLFELVKTSFKMRYQNSILGFLWVLIKPYAMFLIMYVIFSNIIRSSVDNYPLYLLTGVIFITFVNELLVLGQMALLERGNIILKVNFSRQIAIVSALIGAVINMTINLVLIFALVVLTDGVVISFGGFLYLLALLSVLFMWGVGIAFLTSILTVYVRDLKNVVELGMFMMQYATPVFYSVNDSFVDSEVIRSFILSNPLTFFMNQMRAALGIYGDIDIALFTIITIIGAAFTVGTYVYFKGAVKRVAEHF